MVAIGFGKRVEAARLARGKTQGELDRALGKKTGSGYTNSIEAGRRGKNPSGALVEALVRALGASREFLLEGAGPMFVEGTPAAPAREQHTDREVPLYTSFLQWYEDLGGDAYEKRGEREAKLVKALRKEARGTFAKGDPGVSYWPKRIRELADEMKNTDELPTLDFE